MTAVILAHTTTSEIAYIVAALQRTQESTGEWAIRMAKEHPEIFKKESVPDQDTPDPASVRFP
mgnify:CR=1 FL=1